MTDKIRWGLDNPHPFSKMKTELIWEWKYDEYDKRRAVDIAACAMPRIVCGRKRVRAISRKLQGNFCAYVRPI